MPEQDSTKVLVTVSFSDDILERLNGISPKLEILPRPCRTYTDIAAHIWEEAEVLYTASIFPPVDAMPNLKWVQAHSAGVDSILNEPIVSENPKLLITSTRGIHATTMAEHAFAMMLGLARKIPAMLADQHEKEWPENRFERYLPAELRGATLGIAGYGAIGREIARLAKAFGMTVLASKRNVKMVDESPHYAVEGTGDPENLFFDRLYPPQALATMVRDCDFVVIVLPLTDATNHIFNKRIIKAMKPGAFLINMGRGGVVDETALIDALNSGQLSGAGLDVFEEEPLPADHAIWNAPNLIISPHISGNTKTYNIKAAAVFEENLRHYIDGEPLVNLVDRKLGY